MLCLYYYYYIIHILLLYIISYTILFRSSSPILLFLLPNIPLPPLFFSLLPILSFLFSSIIPFLPIYLSSVLFPIYLPSSSDLSQSISSLLFSLSLHPISFKVYVSAFGYPYLYSPTILTPHVLSDGNVEVCRFDKYRFWF